MNRKGYSPVSDTVDSALDRRWVKRLSLVGMACLGTTSFILLNGLWVQLPLFFREMPEGYRISAYMILAMQMANIAPAAIVYATSNSNSSTSSSTRTDASLVCLLYFLIGCGFTARGQWSRDYAKHHTAVLIAFLSNVEVSLGGHPCSAPLLALSFAAGCVSTSSNVVYYPFSARYPEEFTTALSLGQGLSGLVPGLAGLLQNTGGDLRFSTKAYFLGVAGVWLLGLAGLTFVLNVYGDTGAGAGGATVAGSPGVETGTAPGRLEVLGRGGGAAEETSSKQREEDEVVEHGGAEEGVGAARPSGRKTLRAADTARASNRAEAEGGERTMWRSPYNLEMLTQLFLLGGTSYGLLPSISPIMVAGYQDAPRVLMIAMVLGMWSDPLARLLTGFVKSFAFWALTPPAGVCAVVLVICAAMAPMPPLHDLRCGGALPVVAYTIYMGLSGFIVTMSFLALRRQNAPAGAAAAEAAYRWGGSAIQAGAFVGTTVSFLLVVVTGVFYTG